MAFLFDDADKNRREKLKEEFEAGVNQRKNESWIDAVVHGVGDDVAEIVIPDRFITDETRAREAGYHSRKNAERNPGKTSDTTNPKTTNDTTGSNTYDWSNYRSAAASASASSPKAPSAPSRPGLFGATIGYPLLLGYTMWIVVGFVGCTARAAYMYPPKLNAAMVSYQEEGPLGFALGFSVGIALGVWRIVRALR